MTGPVPFSTPFLRRTIARTPLPTTLLAVAVAVALLAAAHLRRWTRVEVDGHSMAPTFLPGDRLLLRPTRRPRVGDVVALPDPRLPSRTLVKRVSGVGRTTVEVRGDDPGRSTDSRHFGPVPSASLVGRAVYRYAPPTRAGRAPWPGLPPDHPG